MRHGCSQPRGRIEQELLGQILGSRADYVYRDAGRPLADAGGTMGQEEHGGCCPSTRLHMRRSFWTVGNDGGGLVATMVVDEGVKKWFLMPMVNLFTRFHVPRCAKT